MHCDHHMVRLLTSEEVKAVSAVAAEKAAFAAADPLTIWNANPALLAMRLRYHKLHAAVLCTGSLLSKLSCWQHWQAWLPSAGQALTREGLLHTNCHVDVGAPGVLGMYAQHTLFWPVGT
jgi:hypothetical protein